MAPPALVNLDSFSDVQFRDIIHRNQSLVAPSANIISKLYTHVSGTTANVSAADVVSIDGSGQGQWDLMLSGTTQRLNANTITTNNTAAWSANSVISVRQASTTIRSANVIVGNLNATTITGNLNASTITGTIQTAAQPLITSLGTLGNVTVGSNGVSKLDNCIIRSFQRDLGTTVNDSVEICSITGGAGLAYVAELSVVQGESSDGGGPLNGKGSMAKHYQFVVSNSTTTGTGSTWRRVVPLGDSAQNAFCVLEINHSVSGGTFLRLVRIDANLFLSNFECTLTLRQSRGTAAVTITPLSGALAGVTPSTVLFQNSRISQTNDRVGINTDNPGHPLDVTGNINTTGSLLINGTRVLGATSLGTGIVSSSLTSVGTLTSLAVTGNLSAGNITVTGDIVFDTPTFKLDSVQNRVGILNSAPAHALDVSGNVNVSVGNEYRINGASVLSGSALGTGVLTSSLTSVGTLGSLTVTNAVNAGTLSGLLTTAAQTNITSVGTLSALTVSGGQITGTLATASQPNITAVGTLGSLAVTNAVTAATLGLTGNAAVANLNAGQVVNVGTAYRIGNVNALTATALGSSITASSLTSVGTLASLAVQGDVTIDSTTMKVDSTLNRVGILNGTPGYTLDVGGDANLTTGNVYRINNTPVLSGIALGSGVLSSSLTSVGTLSALAVTGNIVADGTAFVFNSTTNRVGINLANLNPAYRLDVNGDVNAIDYKINGTIALESTRLGDAVATSNLTTVGNLTSLRVLGTSNLQNLNVTGDTVFSGTNIDFGTYKSISLKRSMAANTVGAGVEGGGVTGGAYKAVVHLLQNEDVNNRIAKSYEFVIDKWSSNGGIRERAIPRECGFIDTTADYNDLGLDVAIVSGSMNFAVVRTRAGGNCSGANITVAITAYYPKDQPVTFNSDTAQLATFIAPAFYRGNQLAIRSTQSESQVAIGTDAPLSGAKLDVNGVIYGRGSILTENYFVGRGLYMDPNLTSTIGLNFGNVWRIWYNPTTQNLEIHKNNNPGTNNTAVWSEGSYTVTGILAAQ